ncbi:uncharacterized protein si:dkey-33c12.4 isoform X1 [Larimichthys crocea]|uniref:uncharacterized protein si:dkey-33c12.4 isoform X1 n=1 Tax=Larimichthys crocea TaxID=215358 RepID=UPI000901FFA9|nr:uncharacterized protein LOC104932477 isoform X1 [Larimichthys crocea]
MSKKKHVVKGEGSVARIRENSRLMRTHETMVDFINGRHPGRSILDVFSSGLFGSDFLHSFDGNLEDDIIYSDEDEDDEDDDDRVYSQNSAHKALEPHPRIRQLTDEEADKHAKELLEEERRKDKTEKNKRKKMRKKAKKRLEKENAVRDTLPDEERGKSDSDREENKRECDETQNTTEEVTHDDGEKKEREKEDEEPKDLDLNNSYVSPEDTSKQRPARARTKDRHKDKDRRRITEGQQLDEEKTKVEEAAIQKKDEDREAETETGTELAAEDFTRRSRELAGVGNRLAASGQYDLAVKYFTDAIRYNPKEFKLFGNRSLCYERTQQYERALRDADLALCMEPNWIKGLFRKGKALCGLKRYYEASLIYKEVLQLDSSSTEAMQELKRAQTLHLMEMGFSWAQSSEALKTHATLEAAVEALFGDLNLSPADAAAGQDVTEPAVQDEGGGDSEWIVRQTSRPRMQQSDDSGQSRSQSPPALKNPARVELFPVWVGSLAPTVTYTTLHELFSRAGTVFSIKMLLEHQCAFVNYSKKEDCDRAIHCINGMVVEGAPLSVRFPNKIHNGLGMSKMAATDFNTRPGSYKKECFFWRTTGCTRSDCTYKHVPEHKNIDKDKFTSRLGNINM